MIWRHLCLARAFAASGFLSSLVLGSAMAGEPSDPTPEADTPIETVKVLDAEKAGMLAVEVRGSGQDRVQVLLRNRSGKKLRVILPPGLVASNAVAQGGPGGGAGGAGGGGGFQNMGLGAVGNQAGGFGQFAGNKTDSGFRSVAPSNLDTDATTGNVTVPVGKSVDFAIPAVCLNFGAPTPTSKNRFRLVDVDDFSTDIRVRKTLRSLATLGTSQGMAQAAMWRVCNNISFDEMLSRGDKMINPNEVALAARFVKAIDTGSEADAAANRIFLSIGGEASSSKDVARLSRELEGLRILGLPVRVVSRSEVPQGSGPILHLGVTLASGDSHETRGKVVVQAGEGIDNLDWTTLGTARFDDLSMVSSLDASSLAQAIDRAVGSTFVTAKVAKRSANGTTLEIKNRLPFTVANVTVKAGASPGAPLVEIAAVGVGPGRNGSTTIPASTGSVERVELNGL